MNIPEGYALVTRHLLNGDIEKHIVKISKDRTITIPQLKELKEPFLKPFPENPPASENN
jgi:hypothetical protein